MKVRAAGRSAVFSIALCLMILASGLGAGGARSATGAQALPLSVRSALAVPHVPGQIIVRFADDVIEEEQKNALATGELTELQAFEEINAKLVETSAEDLEYVLAELNLDPRIEYAEPNILLQLESIPSDPQFPQQWSLENTGQYAGPRQGYVDADIDAPAAWDVTAGSPDVIVAVIDSGIDLSHPEFARAGTIWTNPGEMCPGCATDGLDNDGNGYIDDWQGWDFINQDNSPQDDNGHGTHVAGIIGARAGNGEGISGIAPQTTLMALKAFGAGGGATSGSSLGAILYAADAGADIINASWGGIAPSLALEEAIVYAGERGVLFVAAGGNDGMNTDLFGHFPSALDLPSLVSVGATNNRDELSGFSNYGLRTVDLGAPGEDIYAPWVPDGVTARYRYASGTSMAAPHVTGVAALIKARFPDATPLGIKNLLLNAAEPKESLQGLVSTGARLDAANAVTCSNQPQVWIDRPVPGFAAVPGEPVEVRVLASNCAVPGGVTVSASLGDQTIELTGDGGGQYTGTAIPTAAGQITIQAEARLGDQVDSHQVSGEAVLNYRIQNDVFEWLDATGGTEIPFGDERDFQVEVPLPFAFSFYNRSFEEISIGENGLIGFGGTNITGTLNQSIPDILAPNGFAAPFWSNLDLEDGGQIWYDTLGEAPERKFVVSWIDIPHASQGAGGFNTGPFDGITFQIILEETSNQIVFQYLDADFNLSSIDYGQRATIGLEHFSGTIGRQFSHEEDSLRPYEGTTAIRFSLRDPDQPEILTGSLQDAASGEPYVQQLSVDGGAPPYTWTIVEGGLPAGLGLDPATGTIAGTPYETGTFALTVAATDSNGREARQFLEFNVTTNYRWFDEEFAWIDASDGGEQLPFERDDQAFPVEMPFEFEYFGETFSEFQVSSNGYIAFGGTRATTFSNTALPNPRDPNGTVAVLWDDLSPQDAGGVWVRTVGEAPNRRVVVAWVDVPRFKLHGGGTFEVILEEGSNDIVMQYLDLNFESETYDRGGSATVGLENPAGTVGVQFSYDEPLPEQYIGQTAIRFTAGTPPEPVMNIDALADGQQNRPYFALLSAQGGSAPFTWSIAAGELPPGLALDPATGMITGTPAAVGTFAFTAQATDSGGLSISAEYAITILPNYTVSDGPYEWIEVREGGQRLELERDDSAVNMPLPFEFTFYGEVFNEVQVAANGYLVFGGSQATALRNVPIPTTTAPNGLVAVHWDDLNPDVGQGVWVQVVGEAPNRRFVASWIDVARFNRIGAATFQVILEEGTNRIIYQYQDVDFDDDRYNFGASTTIGLESPSGTIGNQFSFDSPVLAPYEGQKSIVWEQE